MGPHCCNAMSRPSDRTARPPPLPAAGARVSISRERTRGPIVPRRQRGFSPQRRCEMPAVKPIPDGYPTLTPYLIVNDGNAAVAFYKAAFGARERLRLDAPGGKIGHAELEIGDSVIMLADEHPE